jgi:hypothetical protein
MSNWKFHFAMTLCHVNSIALLFWQTLFLNEWKKDIDGWNIACIFNCTLTLIIITYTLPTYYLPTYHYLHPMYMLPTYYYNLYLHITYLPT